MVWEGGYEATTKFVDNLIKSGHGEPVECNAIYLKWDLVTEDYDHDRYNKYKANEYSKVKTYEGDTYCYVTTNYRVLVDNGWLGDLEFICVPIEGKHEPRISVLFGTQIVIASEINRYRKNSKGQRSTRYCNFSKDKFGNEIKISFPNDEDITVENTREALRAFGDNGDIERMCHTFLDDEKYESKNPIHYWLFPLLVAEYCYIKLTTKFGWKAQRARRILPLETHTEMVHTAFLSDWKHYLAQRSDETTGPVHPDIKPLADSLKQQFIELGYIKEGETLK
jgi:thymidylate synthase (FAD)